jgi:hypothetical protein
VVAEVAVPGTLKVEKVVRAAEEQVEVKIWRIVGQVAPLL